MQASTISFPVRAELSLEGRLTERGESAALIAPPHPLYGGSIGNPVVRALEDAFGARGYTTLSFNFRGIGASDGEPTGELGSAIEDMLAAARALGPRALRWLVGYSFGGVTAFASAASLAGADCLAVAPPAALLLPEHLANARRNIIVVGRDDEYAPEAWLRESSASQPVELHVLSGVDHFFLGSNVLKLAQTLTDLSL